MNPQASGVILAGGISRRMGRDKAFLEFDGEPLIQRVIDRMAQVCSEIILVANDTESFARFDLRIVNDVYPGKGSLGGIYSGLQAAREDYALVVACDMPFLNVALLRYLISLAPQADVIVPRARGLSSHTKRGELREHKPLAKEIDLHPTHAVYAKRCLEPMQTRLRADDLRIIGLYESVRVRVVEPAEIDQLDPKHLSFFNVNTPEDFQSARALMRVSNV